MKPELAVKLDPSDRERHQRMVSRAQEAQALEKQAQALLTRANELQAAVRIWAEELHDRYRLDLNRGEGVQEDGTIIRAARPAAPRSKTRKGVEC